MRKNISPYLKIGRATELKGKDYLIYRLLEILPGLLAVITLIGIFYFSYFYPTQTSYFIIAFSVYWILKTVYLSVHLRHNFKRVRENLKINWNEMISHMKYDHIRHLVLLPYYNESSEVVEKSIIALLDTHLKV